MAGADAPTAAPADSSTGMLAVWAGDWSTCAMNSAHRLTCWGENSCECIAEQGVGCVSLFFSSGAASLSSTVAAPALHKLTKQL